MYHYYPNIMWCLELESLESLDKSDYDYDYDYDIWDAVQCVVRGAGLGRGSVGMAAP